MSTLPFDMFNCPLCDGITPAEWCSDCGADHCKWCHDEYGCEGCE